eukprot:COSAG03_NODE_4078_length_1696_cov_1.388854_3_plen_93_part_00
MRRTVREVTSRGADWREWDQEPEYEGYDAVKVKNVHGAMVTLEGGWDGRELGTGPSKEQLEAARKWKEQVCVCACVRVRARARACVCVCVCV